MPDKVSFEPQPSSSGGGVSDVTASPPIASTGGATPDISLSGIVGLAHGGLGADSSSVNQNLVLASPNGSAGAPTFRALVAADLPALPAIQVQDTQSLSTSVAFNAELYLGPSGAFSYSSGGAGFLPTSIFTSTFTRFLFLTSALGVDATVRMRSAAGAVLYTATLTAGATSIDATISVAVSAGLQVQVSIEPVSGVPTINNWGFGWFRRIS